MISIKNKKIYESALIRKIKKQDKELQCPELPAGAALNVAPWSNVGYGESLQEGRGSLLLRALLITRETNMILLWGYGPAGISY